MSTCVSTSSPLSRRHSWNLLSDDSRQDGLESLAPAGNLSCEAGWAGGLACRLRGRTLSAYAPRRLPGGLYWQTTKVPFAILLFSIPFGQDWTAQPSFLVPCHTT